MLRLVLHSVHQDEGGTSDGPGILAGLVGQDLVEGLGPFRTSGCSLEGGVVRRDEIASAVLQQGVVHLVLLHVGVFDIADGIGQTVHESCNAFIALAASAHRPVHGRALANLGLPVRADLAQVIREDEAGTRTVGTAHRRDRVVRQCQRGIQRLQGRIVPFGDLAKVDVGQCSAVELELTGGNALDVDDRHHAPDHGGELHQALGLQVFVLQRHVGSAEVHGLGFDLLDASARTDGLVIDLDAGGLVVVNRPLGIQRRRKGGAGTGNILGQGRLRQRQAEQAAKRDMGERELHVFP